MANQDPSLPMEDDYAPREQSLERSLPHSSEAEQAILGGIILDNSLIYQALEMLMPADFYVPSHNKIFAAMIGLFELGKEINPILIGEELKKFNSLESVGGISFMTDLTFGLPHSTNIAHYAKVVRGKSMLRQLIKAANKITQEALEQEDEPEIILDHAGKGIFDITLENVTKTFSKVGPLAHKSLDKTYAIQQSGSALTGVTTGFSDLDALTLGWQKSDLIILAGRPGMGKTAAGLMFSQNAAIRNGKHVAFFSLEMPEEQVIMRILCSEARVDLRRYRSAMLSQDEWGRLADAQLAMTESKLWIEDTPGISVLRMKAKARRHAAEFGKLDLIVVDYIGLMDGGSTRTKRYESRQQEVSGISRDLKSLAREMEVPLIALCQLNRSPENRTDHRPHLADLRESGALEQDADVVAFAYRGDMYRPASEVKDNTAEIIIAKQRNGPTDMVPLRFDAPSTRFDSMYQDH